MLIFQPQMTQITQIFNLEHRVAETRNVYFIRLKSSLCLCVSVF